MVQLFAQLIGGSRIPVEVESTTLSVGALLEDVAHAVGRPPGSFRLVYGGKPLPPLDSQKVTFKPGDVMVVVPVRQGVPKSLVSAALDAQRGGSRDGAKQMPAAMHLAYLCLNMQSFTGLLFTFSSSVAEGDMYDDEEEEDDPAAELPSHAPAWEVKLVAALKRSGCSHAALEWLVLIRPFRILLLLLFMLGCVVSSRFNLGPPFILITIIVVIFKNLGKRKEGEASAYSIFNPGVQRLPGQLDADDVDRQIRRGQI